MTTSTPLTEQTPSQIDAQIFANQQIAWAAEDKIEHALTALHRDVDDERVGRTYGYEGHWQLTEVEVIVKAEELVNSNSTRRVDFAKRDLAQYYAQQAIREQAYVDIKPLAEEFTRRGGWTRAYIVANVDGHVHNTTRCSSWRYSTRYHWATELSGQDENEIVAQAGEGACTKCYTSAPVSLFSQPRKLVGPERQAWLDAKDQRAKDKAEREAKKAAKAITLPDGGTLRDSTNYPIATVVSAWRYAVDNRYNTRAYGYDFKADFDTRVVASLAAKLGKSEKEISTEIDAKVAARGKREGRQLSTLS